MTEIDVSGCVYYNPQNDTGKWCDLTCERDDAPAFRCEQIKNCVYKQMKRLEAENKKLKEKLEKIEKVILRCKEANCTNCEYQDKCNFNGDDFDDYILRIIRGAEE